MSNYPAPQQQPQQPLPQPRPQYAGPGQPMKSPGGAPYGNVRPGGAALGNQAVRPGGASGGGVRPLGLAGQGLQQGRPSFNGPQPQQQTHQQQQQDQQHLHQHQHQQPQYTGVRPASDQGAPSGTRPLAPPGARPPGQQQFRPNSPLQTYGQAGMATSGHAQTQHAQTPTPMSTPGSNVQPHLKSPPRPPTMQGFPQTAGTSSSSLSPRVGRNDYHHQPRGYQGQNQQQPTPPSADPATIGTAAAGSSGNLSGLHNQISNMSIDPNSTMDQQPAGYSQMPPQAGPPSMQSEIKPRAGARAKRVFATDPTAPPPASTPLHHGQPGVVPPPMPHPTSDLYGAKSQQSTPYHQQQPPAAHQQHQQPPRMGYQQQQPLPPTGYQQQQPHIVPAQQPMNQSQTFRPQAPSQPASKPRIDPDQIPSPVAVQEADQEEWDQKPFVTSVRTSTTPLASSDFMAIDGGNCNPRFFRMTTYNLPNTDDLLNTSQLPMGLVIQPLAQLRADEAPIETIDFGDLGPARCRRCNAYINPYMIFTNGGQKFVCNMCLFENDVEPGYFCNLDMNGRRCDLDQRPELRNGTIEFAVPKEYWNKTPQAAAYVFAIDVSWNSIQSGMLQQCVEGLKRAIWDTNGVSRLAPGTQIGFLTYDKNVHFYNLSPTLEQAQMMVVPDVSDVFVPLSDGFLVNPETSQALVESMLDMLPQLFAENKTTEPVIGAVVQAVRMALENRGGKLILFQTALPTFGPGALRHRDDSKIYGTDKEKTLYAPQDDFYKKLAESCVDAGMSIDLFLFPNAYVDVATLGCLPSITGGETQMFLNFNAARDGIKLQGDIARIVGRPFGFNALMRVRCSTGLRIAEHFGNFHMKNSTDLELAGIDSEKAFGVLVKHDGKLDEKTEASFQVALLYTTADGRRRVRVHNFSTPVTTLLGNVFRWADMDTTINFLSKGAIAQALNKPLNEVREALTEKCVKILSAYRRNCASSTAPGQLILPESFKLFPLYTLSLLKSKMLRAGRDINSDVRVHHMRMVKSMGVSESIVYYYPRMIAIHAMDEKVGIMDPTSGRVFLPPLVRVSYARLNPAGAYLLENGQKLFFWLGQEISVVFLQEVFGVQSLDEVDPLQRHLPHLETSMSSHLRTLQNYMQAQRAKYLDLTIVRQGKDQSELEFSNLLVEDKNNEAMSYVEYLPTIHRMIQTEITTRPHEIHTGIWSR
ncbi:COPII coat Sec23p-Sfb3p heterodimer component [Mortierella claussenii]|nr:COPII coat Sec23p-Sfb3p heterodimer component [Mortierella claussenii]